MLTDTPGHSKSYTVVVYTRARASIRVESRGDIHDKLSGLNNRSCPGVDLGEVFRLAAMHFLIPCRRKKESMHS